MQKPVYEKKSISLEMANKMIEAAKEKARAIGVPQIIAVVDEGGNLLALQRMEGALLACIQIAIDKAYSAVAYRRPTDVWYDFIKDDPPLLTGAGFFPRLVMLGGGFPIKVGDEIIGGIAVSGGHYSHDMECAKAALEVFEATSQVSK
jgi:uncharacterized protein GlcG (DUF336 family)